MNYLTKLVVPFLAVAALTTWSFVKVTRADDSNSGAAAATGTISVTVTDQDDKPVEGATVRVVLPRGATTKPSDAAANQADEGNGNANGEKHGRMTAVATDKTDKDGKVTFKDIPAGDYVVNANMKGVGFAHEKTTVKAGENSDVALKLAPRQKKNNAQ